MLVYCADYRCTHHITVRADRWPDHVRLPDIEDGLVCTACGKRGAEVRLKFSQARTGTGYMPRSCGDGDGPQPFSYAAASEPGNGGARGEWEMHRHQTYAG